MMNRREFLKKGGVVVGEAVAAAVAGGTIALGALGVNEVAKVMISRKEEEENPHEAEAILVEKKEDQPEFDPPTVIGDVLMPSTPREKEIEILLNGKKETIRVSDEQFKSLKVGSKVRVRYEGIGTDQKNIKLLK